MTSQAPKVFTAIVKALEAEAIQGQTASRVATAAKTLVATTGMDANQVLGTLPPETQQTVRAYFA